MAGHASQADVKTCTRCNVGKPTSAFHKNNRHSDGLQSRCKQCQKEVSVYNPATYRKHLIKKHYGITLEQYDRMLAQQGGRCAICSSEDPKGRWKRFCVDHDHETGQVRALLCNDCNGGIGFLKDDPKIVEAALSYLLAFKGAET